MLRVSVDPEPRHQTRHEPELRIELRMLKLISHLYHCASMKNNVHSPIHYLYHLIVIKGQEEAKASPS